ncbi:MAG: hypothetical protein E4H02_09180 [Lentisphaerales bacterium]|nr:MAG: hypothetical protein E4H02_09180 [Lentisphaerales bacterium]
MKAATDKDQVLKVIYSAIDELNELLPREQALAKGPDVMLVGNEGKLDSLGIVNLIVTLERKLAESLQVQVSLTEDEHIFDPDGALRTVDTLAEYLLVRIGTATQE